MFGPSRIRLATIPPAVAFLTLGAPLIAGAWMTAALTLLRFGIEPRLRADAAARAARAAHVAVVLADARAERLAVLRAVVEANRTPLPPLIPGQRCPD